MKQFIHLPLLLLNISTFSFANQGRVSILDCKDTITAAGKDIQGFPVVISSNQESTKAIHSSSSIRFDLKRTNGFLILIISDQVLIPGKQIPTKKSFENVDFVSQSNPADIAKKFSSKLSPIAVEKNGITLSIVDSYQLSQPISFNLNFDYKVGSTLMSHHELNCTLSMSEEPAAEDNSTSQKKPETKSIAPTTAPKLENQRAQSPK